MTNYITVPAWRPARDNELEQSHWRVKHRLKSADAAIVAAYAVQAGIPQATGKRRVSLEIVLGKGQRKADPLAHAKSLLDALKRCGQLVDDSGRWMEWGTVKYSRGGDARTTIILEEIEPL